MLDAAQRLARPPCAGRAAVQGRGGVHARPRGAVRAAGSRTAPRQRRSYDPFARAAQKLPFLRGPTPGFNPLGWDMEKAQEYAKTTVLMSSLQSIILFALALVFLLSFILW